MSLSEIFFVLLFIPISLSSLCKDGNFNPILVNNENNYEIGPQTESCYEYALSKIKNKIAFVFSKINSTSAEVIIYKSKTDINTQNIYDRFLISENYFKEIDVQNLEEEIIYIIIRDSKYTKIYNNIFILYDSQMPISLYNGKPLIMKYFFSTNIYNFVYCSNGNLTFVYSTKVKLKKYLNITYNNEIIIEKEIDETDKIYYLKSEDTTEKCLYISVEDIEPGNEDQEFSVIVYEKSITQFIEIEKNEIINLNYINLNKNDEIQTFMYYYKLGDKTQSNTINFKIDPLAYNTTYINIISEIYHSNRELNSDELEKNFNFGGNKLPIEYDINSHQFKKIYFKDKDTSFPYRYIYFKIEISKLDNYYSPKTIIITIGEDVEDLFFNYLAYYKTRIIQKDIKPYFPTYFKLNLDPKERYIFNSPYPKNTIYVKGDLMAYDENNNIIINKNYFVDEDEIFVFSNISEFTVAVFCSESFKAVFYLEKYEEKDLYVLENMRNNEPFFIKFEDDDCFLKKKKYLLGIYNREIYTKMNKTFSKYWTSNDGEMNAFYRNNISLDGESLFPSSSKYSMEKDSFVYIFNYIDFFTFTCKKPGTLTLRSRYKTFNETTYEIGQNTFNTIDLGIDKKVLQPVTTIKPPSDFLYFGIFSKYGKKITISPDCPELFDETSIEEYKIFTLKVDLYKYEPDQLAIKVKANESTQIEVVNIIRYNFTEYTVLKNNKMTHFTDNHFVKFIDKDTKKIKVIIQGLNNVDISYDLVKLFTDNLNYLPMAYQFRDTMTRKKAKNKEVIELNITHQKEDEFKKYTAFVFSIVSFNYYEFDAQVIEEKEGKKETNKGLIILAVIGSIIIISLIIVFIVCFMIKKKENERKFEMDVDNIDNQPFSEDKNYRGINN